MSHVSSEERTRRWCICDTCEEKQRQGAWGDLYFCKKEGKGVMNPSLWQEKTDCPLKKWDIDSQPKEG